MRGSWGLVLGYRGTELVAVSALVCAIILWARWRLRHRLDILALGRDHAVSLGVAHRRSTLLVLVLVAALASVSNALVGPAMFFGLLVTALAHRLMRTHRHPSPAASVGADRGKSLVGGEHILSDISLTISRAG
ncbi:iron chelate uptake ABC transporter family permease subunit [Roseitranquillus sediminis]|uniref:iron chelate uptake ABC transporter family permease subunit n=1 Tax=Roseitranquillus sediminis TaxID=2809051 RepID=UPI003873C2FF